MSVEKVNTERKAVLIYTAHRVSLKLVFQFYYCFFFLLLLSFVRSFVPSSPEICLSFAIFPFPLATNFSEQFSLFFILMCAVSYAV